MIRITNLVLVSFFSVHYLTKKDTLVGVHPKNQDDLLVRESVIKCLYLVKATIVFFIPQKDNKIVPSRFQNYQDVV
jgi:hypothetical protein